MDADMRARVKAILNSKTEREIEHVERLLTRLLRSFLRRVAYDSQPSCLPEVVRADYAQSKVAAQLKTFENDRRTYRDVLHSLYLTFQSTKFTQRERITSFTNACSLMLLYDEATSPPGRLSYLIAACGDAYRNLFGGGVGGGEGTTATTASDGARSSAASETTATPAAGSNACAWQARAHQSDWETDRTLMDVFDDESTMADDYFHFIRKQLF